MPSTLGPDRTAGPGPRVPARTAPTLTSRALYWRSYCYVRYAMVAAIAAILVAVGWEIGTTAARGRPAVQESLSAYYYTPARSVLVGSLVAIGICLIALRAVSDLEDALLDVAGIGAILVGLVPTPGAARDSARASVVLDDSAHLWDTMRNNVGTLLVVGAVVLVAVLVGQIGRHRPPAGYLFAVGLWVAGLVWFLLLSGVSPTDPRAWEPWQYAGHYGGAGLLFAVIAAVVVLHWRTTDAATGRTTWNAWPVAVSAVQLGGAGLELAVLWHWFHLALALELTEILSFVVFWIWQTVVIPPDDARNERATATGAPASA